MTALTENFRVDFIVSDVITSSVLKTQSVYHTNPALHKGHPKEPGVEMYKIRKTKIRNYSEG